MSLELAETLILPALHRICDERIKGILARTVITRPQLCRLYNGGQAGELQLADGTGSGVCEAAACG